MNFPKASSIRYALFLVFAALNGDSLGCGVAWTTPRNHFDGVNEWGNLAYWEKIGDIDLGNGIKVPLNIGFNSSRTSASPYLGDGWSLAFLEANVVQIDNNHFIMTQPDGWKTRFTRQNSRSAPVDDTSETLRGGGGWMAEIGQNTFTVWAKCGWKMVFTDGKITSITTPKNEQITYNYKNGVVTEVDKDGTPILTVLSDAKGRVSGLSSKENQINFEQADKPNVENIGGQNVIGSVSQSLTKVTLPDGKIENYKFAVDPKRLIPTLAITGIKSRNFSWDPVNKLILSDGSWSYKITPGTKLFAEAQIERSKIDAPNQKEYYYDDNYQGIITVQGLDGVQQITQLFIGAGPLKGRVRNVTRVKDGVSTLIRKYDYDETGKMIREAVAGRVPHEYTFKYNEQGKQVEVDQDGKLFLKKAFDSQGRLISKLFSSGLKETYSYTSGAVEQTTYLKNGGTRVTRLPGSILGTAQSELSTAETQTH